MVSNEHAVRYANRLKEKIDSDEAKFYFESHITVEPVFDDRLQELQAIAKKYGFKVADLLMKKREADTEVRSKNDTFMTSHGKSKHNILLRTGQACLDLKAQGFKVWRYKIEDIIMDSNVSNDVLGVL